MISSRAWKAADGSRNISPAIARPHECFHVSQARRPVHLLMRVTSGTGTIFKQEPVPSPQQDFMLLTNTFKNVKYKHNIKR